MSGNQPKYAVGIDLGTTNCTIAAMPLGAEDARPEVTPVEQVFQPGQTTLSEQLPSFIYMPVEGERTHGAFSLPWRQDDTVAVGAYARARASQVPLRVVASAKSWLGHAGVERRDPILPWQAPDDVEKVSPVQASARYLAHLRDSWDHAHPEEPLAEQELVITVPASFDAAARALTEEAVRLAGLGERFTLLEEPQAAFYAWISSRGSDWREQVRVGDLVLVCDIGGGTTDFSLIEVREEGGALALRRVAVGDHILLGGDNMDLALAYTLRAKLQDAGKTIDDWQLRAAVHGCRSAKEQLLSDPNQKALAVTIPSRGRRLFAKTISSELTSTDLEEILLGGFFPMVEVGARPASQRVGLQTFGLPYATDAAITKHLAAFLGKQRADDADARHPTAVLFNGGVCNAAPLRGRILDTLKNWGETNVRALEGARHDLAVALGAAYYGGVRAGRGVRIRGGTARSYYVGIERAELAVPGIPPKVDAVCVAPFGMEEGEERELPLQLALVVGQNVSFEFFSASSRQSDALAATLDSSDPSLHRLPPIETTLEGESTVPVPVQLRSRVTEVGTIEISAVENETQKSHKLELNIRAE